MAYGAWAGARWRTVWNNGYYRIDVQWDYCQDIENNKTKISMMGQRIASLNGYYSFTYTAVQTGVGDFNGTLFGEERNVSVGGGGTAVVDCTDRHSEVTHNADGTWPTGKAGKWRFNVPLGGANHTPTVGWTNFTIDGEIPTIPRATNPTLSSGSVAMGSAVTINLPRASSAFTHNVTYRFGNATGTISSNAGTSCSWTPPVTLAQQIKSSTSGVGTITVQTKNGNTVIGTKSINITLTVPASVVPTISAHTAVEATANLASKFGALVQTKSTLKVTTTAAGAQGSTITAIKTEVDGRSYNGSPCTTAALSKAGTVAVKTTVTDSRGRTASHTVNVTVIAYSPPGIATSAVARTSDEATTGKCDYSYSISPVGNKNDKSFAIQYLNGSTWTDITRLSADYSKSGSVTTGAIFGVDATTRVRFIAQDYFSTVTIEREVGPTFTLMNLGAGGKSIAIGKLSSNDGSFEVGITPKIDCDGLAGSWIQGATPSLSPLRFLKALTTGAFHRLFGTKTSSGHAVCLGGLGNRFGFYTYKSGRTDNGTDGSLVIDASDNSVYLNGQKMLAVNQMFPVGAVYITYNATNPGSFLGGTWVQFGQGRTLVGQGTGNDGSTSMTFGAGNTGGRYRQNLYAAIGAVNNNIGSIGYNPQPPISGVRYRNNYGVAANTPGNVTATNHSTSVSASDGSAPSHIQPYQVVYYWRRTA